MHRLWRDHADYDRRPYVKLPVTSAQLPEKTRNYELETGNWKLESRRVSV